MTVDKHEVESRIEAAEVELKNAKVALQKLSEREPLEQEFFDLLRAMYIPEGSIEFTHGVGSDSLRGLIKDNYFIFSDEIPDSFYDRFTVHIHGTINSGEIEFKLFKNTKR